MTNHFLLDGGLSTDLHLRDLTPPTLVVHGAADPLFPLAHGRALAAMITGVRMVELDDVGHQLPPPSTWDRLVAGLREHNATQS